jgi:hypothetical protein
MVVPGFPARAEIAHRQTVDHLPGQRIVGKSLCGPYRILTARRREQRMRLQFDTQSVFGGGTKVSFGIHGAGQMIVKIRALGHCQQKGIQLRRALADFRESAFDGSAWRTLRHDYNGNQHREKTRKVHDFVKVADPAWCARRTLKEGMRTILLIAALAIAAAAKDKTIPARVEVVATTHCLEN